MTGEQLKQILPGVLIGGGALVAVYLLSRGGQRSPIVSNALLPTATPVQTPSRDPVRIAGFESLANVALGQFRLQEQSQSIAAQLELGRFRLQEQSSVAGATLEATRAGQQTSLELARIREQGALNMLNANLTDRNYDRELQSRALEQTYALAQQGQIGQGIGTFLDSVLRAIGGQRQQQQPRGGSGGGMGGGQGQGQQRPQQRQQPAYNVPRPRGVNPQIYDPGYDPGFFTPGFNPDYGYYGWPDDDPFFIPESGMPSYPLPEADFEVIFGPEVPDAGFGYFDYYDYFDYGDYGDYYGYSDFFA